MPAATLVSQNLRGTLLWVLKSRTHHPVPREQNMDKAVGCMYLEPLRMKTDGRYYTVIRMNTAAEGTIKRVTARASEIPDGCTHSFCKLHPIAI